MYLIDTHAHLASFTDIKSIIDSASDKGVKKIITVGCTIQEAQKAIQISNNYDNIYATAGLYPFDDPSNLESIGLETYTKDYQEKLYKKIEKLAHDPNVIAIGECGLDYTTPPTWEIYRTPEVQKDLFIQQIDLSKSLSKPLIIHSRMAKEDTISVLTSKYKGDVKTNNGVWHCFSEDTDTALSAIDLGFYISCSGLITYPKMIDLQKAIQQIPLDKILLETDSPYLVPQEKRKAGIKSNLPEYVKIIAKKVAELKGINEEEVIKQTTFNAENLFRI